LKNIKIDQRKIIKKSVLKETSFIQPFLPFIIFQITIHVMYEIHSYYFKNRKHLKINYTPFIESIVFRGLQKTCPALLH